MTQLVNDIFAQAQQGSVAAIIQILNDKLADQGVRTRAIFSDGVLQVLCEAATPEQLEQESLTKRIQAILEAIAPRSIRRVNINSRIVREQQLLWLEEISRDPHGQLLWSQEITLKSPGFLKQLARSWKSPQSNAALAGLPRRSLRQFKEQRQFWRGSLIGGLTAVGLLLAGWLAYSRVLTENSQAQTSTGTEAPISTRPSTGGSTPPAAKPQPKPQPAATKDPFAEAVRVAEQASQLGRTADTSTEWLELAARWRKASDLMAAVPQTDGRYTTAQDRVIAYRRNSDAALSKAQQPN